MTLPHAAPGTTPDAADTNEPPKHGALGHLSADEELQQGVCTALIEDSKLDSSHIGVRVSDGAVILSGSVRSRDDWMRALRIARDQTGARSVLAEQLLVSDH
jgi:osmotically-inducible protein OsmY